MFLSLSLSLPPFFMATLVGQGLLVIEASRPYSDTPHIQQDSSGRGISPTHRSTADYTKHSQETDIRVPGGFEPTIPASELPKTKL